MPKNKKKLDWLIKENEELYARFQARKSKEKKGFVGRILCFIGLHKYRAYKYRTDKAEVGIMSHYFACIRCDRYS